MNGPKPLGTTIIWYCRRVEGAEPPQALADHARRDLFRQNDRRVLWRMDFTDTAERHHHVLHSPCKVMSAGGKDIADSGVSPDMGLPTAPTYTAPPLPPVDTRRGWIRRTRSRSGLRRKRRA